LGQRRANSSVHFGERYTDLIIRQVNVPAGNAAQLVTDSRLADLKRQPSRGPSGARTMAEVTELKFLDLGILDRLLKGIVALAWG
jgi:hypothetical protein